MQTDRGHRTTCGLFHFRPMPIQPDAALAGKKSSDSRTTDSNVLKKHFLIGLRSAQDYYWLKGIPGKSQKSRFEVCERPEKGEKNEIQVFLYHRNKAG